MQTNTWDATHYDSLCIFPSLAGLEADTVEVCSLHVLQKVLHDHHPAPYPHHDHPTDLSHRDHAPDTHHHCLTADLSDVHGRLKGSPIHVFECWKGYSVQRRLLLAVLVSRQESNWQQKGWGCDAVESVWVEESYYKGGRTWIVRR